MTLFLLQGMGQSLHDVGGTQLMLHLWTGYSVSPVNFLGAGYGVGVLIGVLTVRKYVKFNPLQRSSHADEMTHNVTFSPNYTETNLTNSITSDDIQLQVPFMAAGTLGLLITMGLFISQYFEIKNRKRFYKKKRNTDQITQFLDIDAIDFNKPKNRILNYISRTFFRDDYSSKRSIWIKLFFVMLIFGLAFFLSGFTSILYTFFLSYLSKGPAHFKVETVFLIQMLFWALFIVGRLSASIITYKISPVTFFLIILIASVLNLGVFLYPPINSNQTFCWIMMPALGIFGGPLIPTIFTVLKVIFAKSTAVLISFICVGMGLGAISAQQLTGFLLDEFKPPINWFGYKNAASIYIIPFILFSYICASLIDYILVIIFYRFLKDKI